MAGEKDGTLQLRPSGRWAIAQSGRKPVEISRRNPHRRMTIVQRTLSVWSG